MKRHVQFDIFEWDFDKENQNIVKHGVSFVDASKAFENPKGILMSDPEHSQFEERWLFLGKVEEKILTVRFTFRGQNIRILGAGFWRKGQKNYEKENR
jgi:hypothetical protein